MNIQKEGYDHAIFVPETALGRKMIWQPKARRLDFILKSRGLAKCVRMSGYGEVLHECDGIGFFEMVVVLNPEAHEAIMLQLK